MSQPLSAQEADALSYWLDLTATAYASDLAFQMPRRPLKLMVLVYLTLHSDKTVKLKDLRARCRVEPNANSLSNAVTALIGAGLATRAGSLSDSRERELRVTDQGRAMVHGRLLKPSGIPGSKIPHLK